MTHTVVQADAIDFLRSQAAGSLDLVFGSPPYEEARLYLEGGKDLGISRKTAAWVEWMADVFGAAQVACKGLVAFVVAGQTRGYRWSGGPALLIAELHKRGMNLRSPPIYHRVGIPGSGGPDWLRADYEWVVCTSPPGRLPWSDNTACGHPPRWAPGGDMSHRLTDGARVNQWGKTGTESVNGHAARRADGRRQKAARPSHVMTTKGHAPNGYRDGDAINDKEYSPSALANPGNVIHCKVGGGLMGGDQFASQNEAPFPEKLAEFFVLSFCPPGGVACDPFSGSGTTAAVAKRHGRQFAGCDLRASQVELSLKRLAQETTLLFT